MATDSNKDLSTPLTNSCSYGKELAVLLSSWKAVWKSHFRVCQRPQDFIYPRAVVRPAAPRRCGESRRLAQ